jgi:uncharacterized protein (DUF433 family)
MVCARSACAVGLFALVLALAGRAADAAYLPPVVGEHEMVVTEQAIASQVGAEVLARGGNAVDASVAVGYALAVVHPCCGNIGGGGFATIYLAKEGRTYFLDFRERAPPRGDARHVPRRDREAGSEEEPRLRDGTSPTARSRSRAGARPSAPPRRPLSRDRARRASARPRTATYAFVALCLYEESGGAPVLRRAVAVSGGGFCGEKPCWKAGRHGFIYTDGWALRGVRLASGAACGPLVVRRRASEAMVDFMGIDADALARYRWIIVDPDLLGGQPAIRETRLSVSHILSCLSEGMTAEEIAIDYPGFPPEALPEVLRFAAEQVDRLAAADVAA